MGARPPALSSILVAVAFALSVFGFTLFVWLSFGGTIPLKPQGYTFHAFFGPEASQLTPGAQVRISGVPVGRVVKVTQSPRGTDALIQVQRPYAPIPRDSRAIIRLKTLLGETFIQMTPGTRDGPKLPEGGTLPRSQIEPVQAVDEVLGAFDPPTRRALKVFLADLSAAFDGRGEDVNAALGNLPETTEQLAALVELLDRQEPAVRGLVRNGSIALDAIARRESELQALMVQGNRLLAATAARDTEITETVRELPPFLRDLRTTVVDLEATAKDAAPTLRVLRPVAPLVRPALEGTVTLAPQLEELFREVHGMIPTALRGANALSDVLDDAPPLIDALHAAVPQLVPVVHLLDRYRYDVVATLAKLGSSMNGRLKRPDGSKYNYLRALPPLWNEALVGYTERPGSNRYNPYFKPTALDGFHRQGLRAFDCSNQSNPTPIPVIGPGGPPNCMRQHPWEIQGETRSFPHLKAYGYPDQ